MEKTATISDCGLYRYDLTRRWDSHGTTCAFIGLNPSTADEKQDDPTIRRCIGFAKLWGHSRLVMLNAYAFRATNPAELKNAKDPIGPMNDEYLLSWLNSCKMAIAAWGTHIEVNRQEHIRALFPWLKVLRFTKDGFPAHPLYLPKGLTPFDWQATILSSQND